VHTHTHTYILYLYLPDILQLFKFKFLAQLTECLQWGGTVQSERVRMQ